MNFPKSTQDKKSRQIGFSRVLVLISGTWGLDGNVLKNQEACLMSVFVWVWVITFSVVGHEQNMVD